MHSVYSLLVLSAIVYALPAIDGLSTPQVDGVGDQKITDTNSGGLSAGALELSRNTNVDPTDEGYKGNSSFDLESTDKDSSVLNVEQDTTEIDTVNKSHFADNVTSSPSMTPKSPVGLAGLSMMDTYSDLGNESGPDIVNPNNGDYVPPFRRNKPIKIGHIRKESLMGQDSGMLVQGGGRGEMVEGIDRETGHITGSNREAADYSFGPTTDAPAPVEGLPPRRLDQNRPRRLQIQSPEMFNSVGFPVPGVKTRVEYGPLAKGATLDNSNNRPASMESSLQESITV